MTKKINKGHENAGNHSQYTKAEATKRLAKRIQVLTDLVSERIKGFIPMGDLPNTMIGFIEDDWIPNDIDKSTCDVTKNIVYASHNSDLKSDIGTQLNLINNPVKNRKKFDIQEIEIKDLTEQIKNLAAENLRLESRYGKAIEELKNALADSEEIRERYKNIIGKNQNIVPFTK